MRSAGSTARFARRFEIGELALEGRPVGQHRQAGRAAVLIGLGQRRRIEIGADQALRRARLLDLGDQRDAALRQCWRSIACDEAARRIVVVRRARASCSGMRTLASAISRRL